MQQALVAREVGEDVYGFEDFISHRWTTLAADTSRTFDTIFAHSLNAIDIDSLSGSLILCGGTSRDDRSKHCGCVGVFRLGTERQKGMKYPFAASISGGEVGGPVSCAKWFPEDTGIFISGGDTSEVLVWDTACFEVATRISLGIQLGDDDPTLTAVDMSTVPGGKAELVATARSDSADVILVDIGSGAATHRLGGQSGHVTDVKWSSRNPYVLASCATDGTVRLFDVRRAGHSACLTVLDQYKTLPITHVEPPQALSREPIGSSRKRQKATSSKHSGVSKSETRSLLQPRLLGLGCAWESASASQDRRRKRRAEAKGRSSTVRAHLGPALRVRFTPDGCKLISGGQDGRYRLWDSFSGHCLLSSYRGMSKNRNGKMLFEVATDSMHLLSNSEGSLFVHDIDSGNLVNRRLGHARDMSAIAVHPVNEEAYSVSGSEILYWSPGNVSASNA